MTFRKGCVYFKSDIAGMIEETDSGYCFTYDTNFLNSPSAHPISFIQQYTPIKYEIAGDCLSE